jgi:hypothetical protein
MIDFADLIDKYQSLCDYDVTGDIAKARQFSTVCRQLLVVLPMRTRGADGEIEMNVAAIQKELDRVNSWISTNEAAVVGSSRSTLADLRMYRG